MKTILAAALAVGLTASLGTAQDTVRTAGKVEKVITPRRDSVRKIPRDSVRVLFARDSVLWFAKPDTIRFTIPKDSVRWLAGSARFDTSRTSWIPKDSVRFETGKSVAPALYNQNGNSTFAQHLFSAELVMQNQSRLKLTEQQRNLIIQEINRLQATAVNVQWRVADESEKLAELLSHDPVAEAAAVEQMDKMIGFETAVKRAQLSMLIRIRNALTPEQRAMLRSLQKQRE